jgi:hypothetical protein
MLAALPRIAPEQWGSKDNFIDVVGLFNDERNVARGFGCRSGPRRSQWSGRLRRPLDKAHAEDKNFFYRDFALGLRRFDADYEANQIDLFKKSAPAIMQNFLLRAELELSSLLVLINKNYKGFEAPLAQGFGGMADATGVSTSFAGMSRILTHREIIPRRPDCLADEPVSGEPVSGSKFPVSAKTFALSDRWIGGGRGTCTRGPAWNGCPAHFVD